MEWLLVLAFIGAFLKGFNRIHVLYGMNPVDDLLLQIAVWDMVLKP